MDLHHLVLQHRMAQGDVLDHPILTFLADKIDKTPVQSALLSALQVGHGVILKSTNKACIKEKFSVVDCLIDPFLMTYSQSCLILNWQAVFSCLSDSVDKPVGSL